MCISPRNRDENNGKIAGENDADHILTTARRLLLTEILHKGRFLVFRNALERLQRYSHPTSVSSREPMNTSIPHWAMGLACGMVAVVILSVYTANCITNRLGRHPQQSLVLTLKRAREIKFLSTLEIHR
ncbi:unnamed protein product [Nippostrongylus brasiliensis]|uniref:Uncharacterized protein n=1 Tax=Nippostrongylus brasiliensis TaxID=27835 RepID=A0A0N4XPS0_NIPBR|nr:unnamed protein product [Nippostrongylus brasiliensis]